MRPTAFMILAAAISVVFGVVGLVVPEAFAAAFGVKVDAVGVVLARLLCMSYLGYGVINWLSRNVGERPVRVALAAGNVLAWGGSAVLAAVGIVSGLAGTVTWGFVALAVVMAVGWTALALQQRGPGLAEGSIPSR